MGVWQPIDRYPLGRHAQPWQYQPFIYTPSPPAAPVAPPRAGPVELGGRLSPGKLESIAFHEAGHFVFARHLGRSLLWATIDPGRLGGTTVGAVAHKNRTIELHDSMSAQEIRQTADQYVRDEIGLSFAGQEAQRILYSGNAEDIPLSSGDREYAVAMATAAFPSADDRRQILTLGELDAYRVLHDRWPEVEGIAGTLLQKRFLDADDIERLYGDRRVTVPIARRDAQLKATGKSHEIDVIWSTGATVRRRRYSGAFGTNQETFDEELVVTPQAVRLDRLNSGAPFLDSHRWESVKNIIGAVVPGTARIADGSGVATIKLSRAASDASVVGKIVEGIIRNVSITYNTHAVEIIERQGEVPLHRITDWEPMEISGVCIGADAGAQVSSVRATEAKVARSGAAAAALSRGRMYLAEYRAGGVR